MNKPLLFWIGITALAGVMLVLIGIGGIFLTWFLLAPRMVESDLELSLPAIISSTDGDVHVNTMGIDIRGDGTILIDDETIVAGARADLAALEKRVADFAAESAGTEAEPMVVIRADDETGSQRFVDVLNVLAAAGIKNVSIAGFGDDEEKDEP